MNDPLTAMAIVRTLHDIAPNDPFTKHLTVGIYPESLKEELRDHLPLYRTQRLTSLGYACSPSVAMRQDAIEPLRRMCKWIVEETCDPRKTYPLRADPGSL